MKLRRSLVLASLALSSVVYASACSSDDAGNASSSSTTTSTSMSSTTDTSTDTSTASSTSSNTVTMTSTASLTSGMTSSLSATVTETTGAGTTSTSGGGMTSTDTTGTSAGGTGTGGASSSSNSSSNSSGGGAGGGSAMAFTLTSPAFADDGVCSADMPDTCELFPLVNSSYGDNQNPELNWTAGPAGTMGYAVIMHDLSNGFGHWAIWNLSAETLQLPMGLPSGAMLTTPVMGQQVGLQGNAYFGPGSCMNVYEFKVYALSEASFTPMSANNPGNVRDALDASSAVLDTATLRARANPDDCN